MSFPSAFGRGRDGSSSGHGYKDIHIGDDAKAHLGDSYHFQRDSPLSNLPYAQDAPFNSYAKQHDPTCLDNTRVDVLREIHKWAGGEDERRIFWLSGLAGTGKSTIARTVARVYFKRKSLGASFFFSRGGGDVGHAGKFATSIAWQLASSIPALHQHICDAVTERSDITSQSLRDQWHQLVLRPLSKLDGHDCRSSYVLVVDALDECDDENNIRTIPQLLAEARSLEKVQLRVFLTSRPEIPIRCGFRHIPDTEHQDFMLHSISPSIVDHDIWIFLEHELRLVGQERSLGPGWPGENTIRCLVQLANGLFIWAATACRFIREGKRFAAKRLDTILNGSGSAATAPEKHLNEIYITVLKHSVSAEYTDEEKEELYCMLRQILGSIAVLFSPLSVYSLSRLLHVTKEDINQTLEDLHSVLDVPKDQTRPLRLHHPSFRDFLLNNGRSKDPHFWVDEKQAHQTLANSCISLISGSLKQDICSLNTPGVLVTDVESSRVEQCLPREVQYACLYWIPHLQKSGAQFYDNDRIHQFLRKHLLHWLEALSLIRKTSEGILAITSLESTIVAEESPEFYAFVYDAKRFTLHNRLTIETAPLQIYCSALIFAPEKSIIKEQFKDQIPHWFRRLPTMQRDWSSLEQTLEGHSNGVDAVAFSPDGSRLVSGSHDKTLRVWNADTGQVEHTLEGHSDWVSAVAFSPDGSRLASGSADHTVRIWNVDIGQVEHTLSGHSSSVDAVAFSSGGSRLASGSHDRTIRVWNVATGRVEQMLDSRLGPANAVAFSPDGSRLVLVLRSNIQVRNVNTGQVERWLNSHSNWVDAVAFSPDGSRLALGSHNHTIRVLNFATGRVEQTLDNHLGPVNAIAFSPDGSRLVLVLHSTIQVRNVNTGQVEQTLEGHSLLVNAVAFSSNSSRLASVSWDCTVRVWNINTEQVEHTHEGYPFSVNSFAFSPDGSRLASGSDDHTVRVWNVDTGEVEHTLEGYSEWIYAVAFSPDGSRLASASHGIIEVWNVDIGQVEQTLEGPSTRVDAAAFSPDGSRLASGSADHTVRIWNVDIGQVEHTLEGHSNWVSAVAFSPGGSRLASGSHDHTIRVWNVATGQVEQTLNSHSNPVDAVAFSPDGSRLASGSHDHTIRVWNVATGQVEQTLDSHSGSVSSVVFWLDAKKSYSFYSVDGSSAWVTQNGSRILYLPLDYRPGQVATKGSTLAIGTYSGRVLIIVFRRDI